MSEFGSYLFRAVLTPDDLDRDRVRQRHLVEEAHNPKYAIHVATDALGLDKWQFQIVNFFEKASSVHKMASSEATPTIPNPFHWIMPTLSPEGSYVFSIEKIEGCKDEVTKESILKWALKESTIVVPICEVLRGVLGRWCWRNVDNYSASELKSSLYNFITQGYDFEQTKPFLEMNEDELASEIMSSVVLHLKDVHDDSSVPFGMSVMLESDHQLWFGS